LKANAEKEERLHMGPGDSDISIKPRQEHQQKTQKPPMYKVLLHNDNFTTKLFVVEILVAVFHKSAADAQHLMWQVHQRGVGVAGVYPLEVAETKVKVVTGLAREHGFPLRLTLEKE
jgi:ATP-dependent Clp protease adaptor protein ClpS